MTYSAYLVHPMVLGIYFGSFQHTVEYNDRLLVSSYSHCCSSLKGENDQHTDWLKKNTDFVCSPILLPVRRNYGYITVVC